MPADEVDRRNRAFLTDHKRLWILLLVAGGCFCAPLWLYFSPVHQIGEASALILAVLSIAPLFPLYKITKRWPRFSLAIVVLTFALSLTFFVPVAKYAFHIRADWIDYIFDGSEILFLVSSVLFIWRAARG